jgi:hypothetical protein
MQVVQTHVKKIRLGMLQQPSAEERARRDEEQVVEDEVEKEVERYGEEAAEVPDIFGSLLGQVGFAAKLQI